MPFPEPFRKATGLAKSALIVAGMTVLFFVLLEGLSSLALFVSDLARHARRPLAERVHSRYDPVLGWVNLPNVVLKNLYGQGIHFRTNAQGFRNDRDFSVEVPPGRIRAVCSGDSFTLGYGEGNDEAWCQVLGALDRRLETVNMGQGGYGLDQSYLWYLRDGTRLDQDILLFAFITEDFFRVGRYNFLGYAKPVLALRDGRLVVSNVPVPKHSFYFPWLTQNAAIFYKLRSTELVLKLLRSAFHGTASPETPDIQQTVEIASAIFADLERNVREKGGRLVLVYLPISTDYSEAASDPWREFVRRYAERTGIPYIDVVAEYRKLSPEEARRAFKDHYSVEGNRFVAKTVYAKLLELPLVASRASRSSDAPSESTPPKR
jgi:hypothetical protein